MEHEAELNSDNTDVIDEESGQQETPGNYAASTICSAVLNPEKSVPQKRRRVFVCSDSEDDCPASDVHDQCSLESDREAALPIVSCPLSSIVAPSPHASFEQNQRGPQAVPNENQQEEPKHSMLSKRNPVVVYSGSESDCPANNSHEHCISEPDRGAALPSVSCPPSSSEAPPPQAASEQNQGGLQVAALLSGALAKLVYLEEKFDAQAKALERIETSMRANNNEETLSIKEEMCALLPLSTDAAVSSLDDLLTNEDNRKALTHHLGLIGGLCLKGTVKNIMKRCMDYTLAEKYCFTGRKGKKAFKELRLLSVIVAALQKSYPSATENEVHHLIADYLRHAPAYCKKRSRVLSHVGVEAEVPPRPSDH
ncbi:hypothetical protein MTO96_036804 [Rhipicephalus appendiculatus]